MYCKAKNCLIAFGIPVLDKEYRDWNNNPKGRDLLKSQNISSAQYKNEIICLLAKLFPAWQSHGVRVITGLTSDKFTSLFSYSDTQVVILVSHWNGENDTIELFDGMIDVRVLAKRVPHSFKGIIDLSVCRSALLAKLLKEQHDVVVGFSFEEVVYTIWFYIYTAIFNFLDKQEKSYIEACKEIIPLFKP